MLSIERSEPTVNPSRLPNEIELGMVGQRVVDSLAIEEVMVVHSRQ
jgi:hypothetical protein